MLTTVSDDDPFEPVSEALAYDGDNRDQRRSLDHANARARDRVRADGLTPNDPVS